MGELKRVYFVDLPTYPKGVISLGIPAVVAAFPEDYEIKVFDLNILGLDYFERNPIPSENVIMIGLKVSPQNFSIAQRLSFQLREFFPSIPLIWGGELPTLLPNESLKFADSIVEGAFEPIADKLLDDLRSNVLSERYDGRMAYDASALPTADVEVLGNLDRYYQFMGVPMETSRGCDKKCTFCLVHQMQPKYELTISDKLKAELEKNKGRFINLVDYNIGVNSSHLMQVADLIKESEVLGWMAETCLESLDDDELLEKLSESRCRMIYCGLESIEEDSLKSVNKSKTNQLKNYERIIRKVQSYGVQVAAGLILGIEGTTKETFEKTLTQFNKWGIIYTKLTFLTYNPGTKVKESMRKKGRYMTEDINNYDGNHLTFIANGVKEDVVYNGARFFIGNFYSFSAIVKRSKNAGCSSALRWESILFALCFRNVYMEWKQYNIFENEECFQTLLIKPFKKNWKMRIIEKMLVMVRKRNYKKQKTS